MKTLFFALVVLLATVAIALGVLREPGYLLIGYGSWTIQTSLSLFVVGLVIAFAALYLLIRFLVGLRRMPQQVRGWERRRRSLKAHNALNRGLIELSEGQWSAAERRLIKHADDSDNQLLNYLAAARAAQRQGADQRRDHYLRMAHRSMPAADVAVGLTQAELQIAHRQMEQALATLTHLRTIAPRHAYVLRMLMKLYLRLRDWSHLRDLLPELRRRQVIDDEQAHRLELQVYGALLGDAGRKGDLAGVREVWEQVPRRLAREEPLVLICAGYLSSLKVPAEAAALVEGALKRYWSERLVYLYGQIEADAAAQFQAAEGWLKDHDKDPVLLLALGRLAQRNQLWGKARSYLEASIGLKPTVEAYQLLGSVLEQMNEPAAAMECYRKGVSRAAEARALPAPNLDTGWGIGDDADALTALAPATSDSP